MIFNKKTDFFAYHNEVTLGSLSVSYSVIQNPQYSVPTLK